MAKSAHLKLGVTLPNADALGMPYLADFVKPDFVMSDNLLGLYVFSGSESRSLTNYANPALPLTKIGSPLFEPRGAVVSRGNGFDTGIVATANMTFVVLYEDAGNLYTNGGILISTLTPASITGTAFQRGDQLAIGVNGDGVIAFFRDRAGTAQISGIPATMTYPQAGGFVATAVGLNQDNTADAVTAKAGVNNFITQSGGNGAGSRTLFNKNFLIGMGYDAAQSGVGYSGKMRIKALGIYNAAMNTSTALANLMTSVRTFGGTAGISGF